MRIEFTVASASRAHSSARRWHSSAWSIRRSLPRLSGLSKSASHGASGQTISSSMTNCRVPALQSVVGLHGDGREVDATSRHQTRAHLHQLARKATRTVTRVRGAMAAAYVELGAPNLLFHSASGPLTMWPRGVSYSSWRRHQTPFSLRPFGARSSHWYMPQSPSTPRE